MFLVGVYNGTVSAENNLAVPQEVKQHYHVMQPFYS